MRMTMPRAEALERYQALPLPTKSDEHWRFTDLTGFDPDTFTAAAGDRRRGAGDDDRARCVRCRVRGRGGDHDRARTGGDPLRAARRRPPAARDARRARREVRGAQRRDVDARPARARAEGRRRREAALRQGRQRDRGRLAVLAPAHRRRAREPVHGGGGVRVCVTGAQGLLERGGRDRRRGRARRSSTCPCRTCRRARGISAPTMPGSGAMPSSTGSPAASARVAARCGSRTTLRARGRPRGSPAPTSRTACSASTTTRSRSTSRPTRPRTSHSRARCATPRARSGAA